MKKVNLSRKFDLGRKIQLFKDRFKTCFDTAKSKISTNAAIPAKKYGFTKHKKISVVKNNENIEFRSQCRIFDFPVRGEGTPGGGLRRGLQRDLNPRMGGLGGTGNNLTAC